MKIYGRIHTRRDFISRNNIYAFRPLYFGELILPCVEVASFAALILAALNPAQIEVGRESIKIEDNAETSESQFRHG